MTLSAIEKLAIKLPLAQRLKLAGAMWKSIPPMRDPLTLEELKERTRQVESGEVKAVSEAELDADLDKMELLIRQRRSR